MNSYDDLKKQQDFLDEIASYKYIEDDGCLLLEPFCVYLSACFNFDGIPEKSPQPVDIYMLLVNMIRERFVADSERHYIYYKRIIDWSPALAFVYPEKKATCVHLAALVQISHDWIYDIGHILMQIPEPDSPTKYFDWVKEEWVAVYGFINGYHNAFYSFQKEFDRKGIQDKGFSLFEALHLSRYKKIDFDAATELLKTRHESYMAALSRVEQAILDGYFLEAITLQESLISNCLFNYLVNIGTVLDNPSFNRLLKAISKSAVNLDESTILLFKKLDAWRIDRNKSMHGFITATSDSMNQSRQSFERLAETTAKDGKYFCNSVVLWYELECVNFIPHQFQSKIAVH
ncbi:hypothetical protein [Methylotenera sp. L2L1]|jgi:hypothetical protein|uniref:hypothetical protein n=1 Tax=Methylotenera sp. L2L1 TaxID=1502770 RepID=UPI00055F313B|nr:hypothetical protein [Methylotenera sp. L2L1]